MTMVIATRYPLEQPGPALNWTSSLMGAQTPTTWWRRCLWAVLHIRTWPNSTALGPIQPYGSWQAHNSWTSLCASHRATDRPLIKVTQNIYCHFVCANRKYMSAAEQYYPSIKYTSILVHFRMVFQHQVTHGHFIGTQ